MQILSMRFAEEAELDAKVGKDSGFARDSAEYTPIIYNKNEAQL